MSKAVGALPFLLGHGMGVPEVLRYQRYRGTVRLPLSPVPPNVVRRAHPPDKHRVEAIILDLPSPARSPVRRACR